MSSQSALMDPDTLTLAARVPSRRSANSVAELPPSLWVQNRVVSASPRVSPLTVENQSSWNGAATKVNDKAWDGLGLT